MSLLLKIESLLNALFFAIRSKLKISRHGYQENPCRKIPKDLSVGFVTTIERLQKKYPFRFEEKLNLINTLENYHLLDVLDQAQKKLKWKFSTGEHLLDIGSKNFYYASVLFEFLKPKTCTGIEIDGYKLYRDFFARAAYARFYTSLYPGFSYQVTDLMDFTAPPFDGITWFYPFVIEYPLVKWSLPLSLFRPKSLFEKAFSLLKPGGWLLMMNHGQEEFDVATKLAKSAGFNEMAHQELKETLLDRDEAPVISWWKKAENL